MFKLINTWFRVDSRALGIYRILLGWLCFWDIARRWNYIDIFYSDLGIKVQYAQSKSFTIFNYIGNDSFIVHLIFAIGILSSILLMIGYRSKLFHFITAIIVISIHVYVTKVGNSGDMFLNCMLIWTLFLPLGKSLSLDSLIKSLSNFKENKVDDLNDRTRGINAPSQIYSIAYFAMLLQISIIYFFTALDKNGWDWLHGKAFYKMHQMDAFVTPIGYYLREYINYPISKFFTQATLYMEYSVLFLLFIPFYRPILRSFAIVSLTIFHIMIRISVNVGLFSQVMITSFALLLDKKIIDYIKYKYSKKYRNNTFILFYDSDCGFCHYTVRIIKRIDVFNVIVFADSNTSIEKPETFNDLVDKTAILYSPKKNKIWTRHEVFGKILSLLPFGFLISWIFFIPFISEIFGIIYDKIAQNRTKISIMFGLPACNLPGFEHQENNKKLFNLGIVKQIFFHIEKMMKIISPVMITVMLVAAIFSAFIENPGAKKLFKTNDNNKPKVKTKKQAIKTKDFSYGNMKILHKITRFPRMVQMWKMFSPNVPASDKIIIVEAFLDNGETIDPFTGKPPIFYSTDYSLLMKNKSQLWRKYFENFKNIDGTTRQKRSFKNWIINPENDYFEEHLNGHKIDSIKIWKVTQKSSSIKIQMNRKWDDKESFTDINKNGVWDQGDPFNDINNNFKYDTIGYCWCPGGCGWLTELQCNQNENFIWIEETFEDSNKNGVYDPPEPFKDNNRNNKFDETAEEYTDTNGNGRWDKEEPFVDRITTQIDYPKTGPKKECLSCKKNKKNNTQVKDKSNNIQKNSPDSLKDYFKKLKKQAPNK